MKKVLFVCMLFSAVAFNEEKDIFFMGNYEGTFRSKNQSRGTMFAKVIAEGENSYRAVIRVGPDKKSSLGGILKGKKETDRVNLKGRIDIDYDTGGAFFVNAFVENGEIMGNYSGGDETGTIQLNRIQKQPPTLGKRPPQNALVLFDGSNVDNWQSKSGGGPTWEILAPDILQVRKGSIVTKELFKDCYLHLEFRTPFMPNKKGQKRGNSGVYLQGLYEIQILDSFGLSGKDNECGGIYKIAKPLQNACLPPLEWQTYDITFRAAKFNDGRKVKNARITVYHNGELIHDETELPKPNGGALSSDESQPGGLMLQDHNDPVQFRNIWLQRLD